MSGEPEHLGGGAAQMLKISMYGAREHVESAVAMVGTIRYRVR